MKLKMTFALIIALVLLTALIAPAGARPPLFEGGMSTKRTVTRDIVASAKKQPPPPSQVECIVTSGGANTNLDCDDPFPNNEPDIEVNPVAPGQMVASSNDYGSCCDQFYTTLDNAATWTTGNMSHENADVIGSDPVTVFDVRHGRVIHASLNYRFNENGEACRGDLVASLSSDGGITWATPVVVDAGVGCDLSKRQLFNDKEWIVTDNHPSSPYYGRTYLTWTKFESAYGSYVRSAIFESHSDDGGKHWTRAKEISGSNAALCTYQTTGPAGRCDENQFSVPTVGPDGSIYVAFENGQNESLWEPGDAFEDQYLMVKSTNGGQTWSSPSFVVGLEDGTADYPFNVNGRQTLTGYQVRVNSAGNIVASPTDGTLYLVFSDNRNGIHNSADPVTNTDVFLMTSWNGGDSWNGPIQVDSGAGDQWFPWVEVNPTNGEIGIVYHDRGDSNGPLYDTALVEGTPGSLVKTIVNTAPSDPTQSIFFQAEVEGCETCATFHGDYNNVSYGADGAANIVWTDMRDVDPDSGLHFQFIYYAQQ